MSGFLDYNDQNQPRTAANSKQGPKDISPVPMLGYKREQEIPKRTSDRGGYQEYTHGHTCGMRLEEIRNCASEIGCKTIASLADRFTKLHDLPMVAAENQPVNNRSTRKPPKFGTNAVPRRKSRLMP